MRTGALLAYLLVLWAGLLPAQDAEKSGIVFQAADPEIIILLNGEAVRPAPGDTVMVPAGRHVVEGTTGDRYLWADFRIADTLDVGPGEYLNVRVPWERSTLISSHPDGADVFDGATRLGVTPFLFREAGLPSSVLTVRAEGFLPQEIRPSRSAEYVFLLPEAGHRTGKPQVIEDIEPPINNRTLTIASAVVMVGSSIAAAYLKEKANRSLDEYQRTGSAAALRQVRTYDNYSAVAAATMVVSFTGFALFLTSD